MDSTEAQKWQQHLSLLREQYVNLYNTNTELQREYAIVAANKQDTGFIGRLLTTIGSLYSQQRYSDVIIKLKNQEIPAHKFILSARTDFFSEGTLSEVTILDWTYLEPKIGLILLKWIYTGKVPQENLTLELMKAASNFSADRIS